MSSWRCVPGAVSLAIAVFFVLGCTQEPPGSENGSSAASPAPAVTPAPQDIASTHPVVAVNDSSKADAQVPQGDTGSLFKQLDDLGRDKVRDAKFVTITLVNADDPDLEFSRDGWQVAEDNSTVTLLENDLLSWTYNKTTLTTIPSSWSPAVVRVKSIKPADFQALCRKLSEPSKKPEDESSQVAARLYGAGPSERLLISHAAWKRGVPDFEKILAVDPMYSSDKDAYSTAVMDDLAWLHFLRGVNLLMFADRAEVLPHLRLVPKLAPKAEFTATAVDLAGHLQRLIDGAAQPAAHPDKIETAESYISLLKDLHCVQVSQPGWISPYFASVGGMPDENPPSKKLADMGMAAVPALIKALEDDTPTRTVYHWRDFHRSRMVWRVSDFAWTILRDISQKDFGNRRVVGFSLSSMSPPERRSVTDEVRKWYSDSKTQTPDDRMFAFFSSPRPDDWMTAGQYFLKTKNRRAVPALLERIKEGGPFRTGDLCELVARFGDPQTKAPILEVLKSSPEASDRIKAAIALWELGDPAGIPVAIEYVTSETQPYGSWDEPVWFLMRSHTKKGLEALRSVILKAPVPRASEVLGFFPEAITGDLYSHKRESAGSLEICPVLIAAMSRSDYTGGSINDIKTRFKDLAAKVLVLLRQGWDQQLGGRFVEVDPALFNELEPDEEKRDSQIQALVKWYEDNRDKLVWDETLLKLVEKKPE